MQGMNAYEIALIERLYKQIFELQKHVDELERELAQLQATTKKDS